MKKRIYKEKYNMVNGDGEVLKEGLTIDDIKNMKLEEPSAAKKIKIPKIIKKKSEK